MWLNSAEIVPNGPTSEALGLEKRYLNEDDDEVKSSLLGHLPVYC